MTNKELFKIGTKVKLLKTSQYYYQAPDSVGEVIGLKNDRWCDVLWEKCAEGETIKNCYHYGKDLEIVLSPLEYCDAVIAELESRGAK
jgi:hypothetical protein